jgi:hypothetical protein
MLVNLVWRTGDFKILRAPVANVLNKPDGIYHSDGFETMGVRKISYSPLERGARRTE